MFLREKDKGLSLFTRDVWIVRVGAVFQHYPGRRCLRLFTLASLIAAGGSACLAGAPQALGSPVPEPLAPREAWRIAESMAAKNPRCEVMIGSGGSMLPLYPDRTVLLVERMAMSQLRQGMTVVFIGDRGRPVAHTLIAKTPRGWLAQGLANQERDRTVIAPQNYLGTVVRAFTPVIGANSAPAGESASVVGDSGN